MEELESLTSQQTPWALELDRIQVREALSGAELFDRVRHLQQQYHVSKTDISPVESIPLEQTLKTEDNPILDTIPDIQPSDIIEEAVEEQPPEEIINEEESTSEPGFDTSDDFDLYGDLGGMVMDHQEEEEEEDEEPQLPSHSPTNTDNKESTLASTTAASDSNISQIPSNQIKRECFGSYEIPFLLQDQSIRRMTLIGRVSKSQTYSTKFSEAKEQLQTLLNI